MAGCPVRELCFSAEYGNEFGYIEQQVTAGAALVEDLRVIELLVYDHSVAANIGRSPFVPAEKPLNTNALISVAVQIVCRGNPITPYGIDLTKESQDWVNLSASVGCHERCRRYIIYHQKE